MSTLSQLWEDPRTPDHYTKFERITEIPARRLIAGSGILESDGSELTVIDSGCGSGIVTSALMEMTSDAIKQRMKVTCGDKFEGMVAKVKQRIESEGWKGVEARILDAQRLDLPDAAYTHLLCNFVFNVGIGDWQNGLKECYRVLKPGGACAISTWKNLESWSHIKEAMATIAEAPPVPDHDDLLRLIGGADWHDPAFLEAQLAAVGFKEIRVEVVPAPLQAKDAAECVQAFSPLLSQFMKKLWQGKEIERQDERVIAAFLEYLNNRYGEGQPFEWEMNALVTFARKDW